MKSSSRGLLIILAILVVSEATSFSFVRSYSDYSVTSPNGRFVAEIRWKNDVGTLRAYQAGKMSRKFLWEVSIPTPTSETVHLSDDGRYLVLEENYPYTDDALEFYDSGRLVKTISRKEVFREKIGAERGRYGFGSYDPLRNMRYESKWSSTFGVDFRFMPPPEIAKAFCVCFPEFQMLKAWDLESAREIDSTNTTSALQKYAVELAEKSLATLDSARKARTLPSGSYYWGRNGLPSWRSALCLLATSASETSRGRIEQLLTDEDFQTSYGISKASLYVSALSHPRAYADHVLAILKERKFGLLGAEFRGSALGKVDTTVMFPSESRRKLGVFWAFLTPVGMEPKDELPGQKLVVRLKDAEAMMKSKYDKRYGMPEALDIDLATITPGEYWLRGVLRRGARNADRTPFPLRKGDYVEEEPILVKVEAGKISRAAELRCTKLVK